MSVHLQNMVSKATRYRGTSYSNIIECFPNSRSSVTNNNNNNNTSVRQSVKIF